MKKFGRSITWLGLPLAGVALLWACPFDTSLREYLSASFWLPFTKTAADLVRAGVPRISEPFAGMSGTAGPTPMAKLRAAYQEISQPSGDGYDVSKARQALAAARAAGNLSQREREELDLLDAKIDMRAGSPDNPGAYETSRQKLIALLKNAKTPEYLSEARGWLARDYYLLGDRTRAGKIYLDELNRVGSNLSVETVLTSLRMVYGHSGGTELPAHLDQYFDTPEHAAFAIQVATNPRAEKDSVASGAPRPYAQIRALLDQHKELLRSASGARALATLSMRVALHAGDPPAALQFAAQVPADSAIRTDPDFLWMLASANYLSKRYAAAGPPLLQLFASAQATANQKAAAAYALCGVYQKLGDPVEQLRYAAWLDTNGEAHRYDPGNLEDGTIYWASSGFDLGLLLDAEAPTESLRAFLGKYPADRAARLVKYSLAVRLARDNQYAESARIYQEIGQMRRAPRMRQMAALYGEATRTDLQRESQLEAKFKLAQFLSDNSNRIYFNDLLWGGLQRYALTAESEGRFTRAERARQLAIERKLKDDQEELWRAHLILREVVRESGNPELGQRAAQLAIRCVRQISERFGRADEIRAADIELSVWLKNSRRLAAR